MNTKTKTLSQLENNDWGAASSSAPPSIKRCYELRNMPLGEMGVEDIRLLIGFGIGLQYLMPMAVQLLEKNPLAEGEHYPGDLLVNVLDAGQEYYESNPEMRRRVEKILDHLPSVMGNLDFIDYDCLNEALSESLEKFRK